MAPYEEADVIFHGGEIVPVTADARQSTAGPEVVAVKDGVIVHVSGHRRLQGRQRGHQLPCHRGGLPQRDGPLDRSGVRRHPGQHACGALRLGFDPWAERGDGPPTSGLTEDRDSRMTGDRR
ncbi:hypothetical protein ACFZB9_08100 [Kitasatospora sp. NPDC008050]|uniref:hypothetical protein n=1 Tax=Kitasatospora sp. NPDC008050 TaxID=3364021 RepID=UPI0036EB562D